MPKTKVTIESGIATMQRAKERQQALKRIGYTSPKIKKYYTRGGKVRYEVYVVANVPSRYL